MLQTLAAAYDGWRAAVFPVDRKDYDDVGGLLRLQRAADAIREHAEIEIGPSRRGSQSAAGR